MTSAGGIVTCQQAGFLGHQKEVMQRLFQSTNLSFSINFTSFPRIHPQNTHFITKYYKLKKKTEGIQGHLQDLPPPGFEQPNRCQIPRSHPIFR
jgi:hypothetical protein